MRSTTFERSSVGRIRLHVLPTDRFKTYAISAYIGTPLSEDKVTPVALAPFVLRRGTEKLPETKQFREKLDDLYGAGFGFDVYKRGDYQMIQFHMDMIQDHYVKHNGSLLGEALQFLSDAITRPALEGGRFVGKYVDAEKETVRKRIEAIVNDKIRYSAERCIEEMCRNEPYRLRPLGKIADLQQWGPSELYEAYGDWLATSPIDLYVVGQTSMDEVRRHVSNLFPAEGSPASYAKKPAQPEVRDTQTIVEKLDVNQGKLNMGLRTYITYADPLYPAALMYNGIFGGFPHSKLFVNVREKESLAYYASSRLDGHKGILTVQSGIEIENYEKAVAIIREQLEAMAEGEISDLELSQTRAMIGNHLREIEDSAFEMIGFDFNSVLSGIERTVPGLIEKVESLGVADIRQAAERVKLDTIYFLRDDKGEAQHANA